ncbi:hypothetical protein K0M31_012089 [Melipona bicolor]|uniref:Nose resistant-to-fluoxetine protein N-terminal domain-containing protein n=1 Tax=Melipona bicolor TaxID=60889 RepID=A0AA40KVM4_9HYME|nr:hypothetical protein K0M31_012089 [Melipona bicolor]
MLKAIVNVEILQSSTDYLNVTHPTISFHWNFIQCDSEVKSLVQQRESVLSDKSKSYGKSYGNSFVTANDASGRYTNSFFWGNSYYVGSSIQCAYINENYGKKVTKTRQNKPMEELKEFDTESRKKHGGLTSNDLWIGTRFDKPPYKLGFYMMTISLNTTFFPRIRMIYLGVCLPFSCNASDVSVIAKLAGSKQAMKHSSLEKIRDQHDMYDMYEDPVFWILFAVTATVFVLMVIGTGYDIYVTRKYTREKNVIYDLERHAKFDQLTTRTHKSLSGKIADVLNISFLRTSFL